MSWVADRRMKNLTSPQSRETAVHDARPCRCRGADRRVVYKECPRTDSLAQSGLLDTDHPWSSRSQRRKYKLCPCEKGRCRLAQAGSDSVLLHNARLLWAGGGLSWPASPRKPAKHREGYPHRTSYKSEHCRRSGGSTA